MGAKSARGDWERMGRATSPQRLANYHLHLQGGAGIHACGSQLHIIGFSR
jgi:hypothetical protein